MEPLVISIQKVYTYIGSSYLHSPAAAKSPIFYLGKDVKGLFKQKEAKGKTVLRHIDYATYKIMCKIINFDQIQHIENIILQRAMQSTAGFGGGNDQTTAGAAEVKMMKNNKVMVAIDESDGSFYALKWALDHLFPTMATDGALTPDVGIQNVSMVYLVHVQPPFHPHVYPVGPGAAVADSVKRAEERTSAAILSRALEMCRDKQVRAESLILKGDPREMICQAADEMHVDLLVLGSRGLGKLKRAFLGSVSDYCAHHAKSPILIVKPALVDDRKKH
ncbi:hypothetical protein L6164_009506 [Bauhinia variegata]|uniref:Uncharacterized protein n=1 Tax=Bauhinia variegata TaxID=167791 RepID=A0ACB9PLK7_BAUVA|nr:hypothetical protein L6164_009506 [Bauhinia variegata]